MKPEIQDWVDFKVLEFARKECKGSVWNPTKWLGWYLYTNIHEILFSKFPIVLHEWFSKFTTQQIILQGGELREWNPQLIDQLKRVRNPVLRAVDFWIDNILEGYITKFVVDTKPSYSEAERNFFKDHVVDI